MNVLELVSIVMNNWFNVSNSLCGGVQIVFTAFMMSVVVAIR
jgi:hypothetical protein